MRDERGAIHVSGGGNDGPESRTPRALTIVEKADVLVGGQRLLDRFPHVPAERVKIGARVDEVLAAVAARRTTSRGVVLATRDPHYFGITRALLPHLPAEDLAIVPHVGALPWAFAQARAPWGDAALLTP